jgi:hypothetical protein
MFMGPLVELDHGFTKRHDVQGFVEVGVGHVKKGRLGKSEFRGGGGRIIVQRGPFLAKYWRPTTCGQQALRVILY